MSDAVAKLACLAIAVEFDRRYRDAGIYVNAVHPGVVATAIFRDPHGVATAIAGPKIAQYLAPLLVWGKKLRDALFAYSPKNAARTVLFAAASPSVVKEGVRGRYIVPEGAVWPMRHPMLFKPDALVALWEFSDQLVAEMVQNRTPNVQTKDWGQ